VPEKLIGAGISEVISTPALIWAAVGAVKLDRVVTTHTLCSNPTGRVGMAYFSFSARWAAAFDWSFQPDAFHTPSYSNRLTSTASSGLASG
jgi:hypothetical protein